MSFVQDKWDRSKVAHELCEAAKAAKQLEIRFGNICRNAERPINIRMPDSLDMDLTDFIRSATEFADALQAEADAEVT